ncbi:MAG: amino acid ABC transporter ATP-binding protein [Lachnospiraceae bacterium]|nr:amino acid ABC transporter ATP-binding protein [Lachnospiraceae bacterium]
MIKIEHLKKAYPNVTPLKDVNTVINDGDVISIIGPSGTGKSTLMRCINRLETPTSGRIWVDGVDVTDPATDLNKVRLKMGMVFQSFNLFEHLTVIENIMLAPVELLKKTRQEAYDRGMELLKTVGLANKALNYPDELSGGQKQRIAIARTLATDPDIILFDEPTSALDPTMVGEVQSVIKDLVKTGKTMMIVTHEMNFARAICNRVFYMDEGGIYEDGSPEQVFDNPQKEKTRIFIKKLKVLELNIDLSDYSFIDVMTKLSDFCDKNNIGSSLLIRLRMALEETIVQVMSRLVDVPDSPDLSVSVEYNEAGSVVRMSFEYSGPENNVTVGGDKLSVKILSAIVYDTVFSYDKDATLPNRLEFWVR